MDTRTASPELLVARLLVRAVRSMQDAREAPAGAERTTRLRRVLDILAELRRALDFGRGGEIAFNLDRLYEYASDRLLRAGVSQTPEPIDEALAALAPLAEAWSELSASARAEAPP
jgi:flagellar protein FliS